ncbi:helix-turn-helix domain-containing protein [Alteromonas lipolytica]|uniref:helix-turn-helix domain-containing protein n=1 Tax=Alteromonas lipolytica TaxID=1856405 RepID=UPI001E459178|nr:helix-turn-helix domain-containing protein [Alteromonas lipolytica]
MSVSYTGSFWSAVTRALLSLRRDKEFVTENEAAILEALSAIESGEYPVGHLNETLHRLLQTDTPHRISQSLLGYLDFNKMGSFHCYLSMCQDISAALAAIQTYCTPLFEPGEKIRVEHNKEQVELRIKASTQGEMEPFMVAFLLALFRHLAGRHFDFTKVEMVSAHPEWLLKEVSTVPPQEHCPEMAVSFASEWLNIPSFFYSPKLQMVLAKNLQTSETPGLKQDLLNAFKRFDAPARIRSEAVAESLGMTESTLRRKLKQENLSFSALLKSHIHERSINGLLSGEKIDTLAAALGFSDRRSFDRSFKEYTGVSPGQLRQVGSRLRFQRGNQALIEVTETLPPLPETINHIIHLPDERLTVSNVVKLIEPDPVFLAHIIGKASKAVYGSVPHTPEQAIGRNLGVQNVRNLAVLFAAQQYLTTQSVHPDIEQLTDAMLLSNRLFEHLFGSEYSNQDSALISQLMLFGPLALILIFHTENLDAARFYEQWQTADTFETYQSILLGEHNLCLYGASSLLLMRWGFTSKINQTLWRLCQNSDSKTNVRIRLCHELAFNYLCFDKAESKDEQLLALLDEDQQEQIKVLLANW